MFFFSNMHNVGEKTSNLITIGISKPFFRKQCKISLLLFQPTQISSLKHCLVGANADQFNFAEY